MKFIYFIFNKPILYLAVGEENVEIIKSLLTFENINIDVPYI